MTPNEGAVDWRFSRTDGEHQIQSARQQEISREVTPAEAHPNEGAYEQYAKRALLIVAVPSLMIPAAMIPRTAGLVMSVR